MGLGGGFLGKVSFAEGVATARRALDLAVTYIDTSPWYNPSQSVLGEALGGTTEGFLQATKLGYFKDPRHYRSADAIRSQLHENLRVLRRDSVDVLQLHEGDWAAWWDDATRPGEAVDMQRAYDFEDAPAMQMLREAKEKGWCRYFGITGNRAAQTAYVLRHVEVDTYLIACNYNIVSRGAATEAFPLAREKGVALVLGAPFHQHMNEPHPEWIESPPSGMSPDFVSRLARIYAIQRDAGMSLVELNLRWIAANPDIAVLLTGAATTRELEENFEAVAKGPLPPDLHQAVDEVMTS